MTASRRFSLGVAVFVMGALVVGFMVTYFYVLRVDQTFLVNVLAKRITEWILNSSLFFVVSLLGVILLANSAISIVAVMLGVSPARLRHLTIDGEGGQISVALDAVEEFLRRKGSAVSGVKDLQVHAEVSGGLLVVHTRLVLILARDIPSFSREFQGLLRNEVTKTLGFQNIKEIRVIIQKMVTEEPTPVLASAAPVVQEKASEPEPEAEPAHVEAEETPFWAERSDEDREEER